MKEELIRSAVLEAQVEAALGGHLLGPFEDIENGYQSTCEKCNQTTWVGKQGLRYSLLDEVCLGNGR